MRTADVDELLFLSIKFLDNFVHQVIDKANEDMRIKIYILIALLLSTMNYVAAKRVSTTKISETNCAGVNTKIERLNSQLRAGYKVKQGEVWKAKLRKLKKQRYACRKKNFSTR